MSDERFRFQFELLDKMSGPARAAAASLTQLNLQLNQLNQVNLTVRASTHANASGMESWITKLNSAIGVAKAFVGVLESMGGALAGVTRGFVGMVLDRAKAHERARNTLEALYSDQPGRARQEMSASQRLGRVLPGTGEEARMMRVGLATAGFTDRGTLDRRFALGQDLSAMSMDENDAGLTQRIVKFMGDVQQERRLRGQELNQLSNLHTAVGRGDLFRELARGRGLQGSEDAQFRQVSGLVSDRAITADETFAALERAMVARTHKQLGGQAISQGTGLVGQLANAEETPSYIIDTWLNSQNDVMKSGGMSQFGGFLGKFNEFFDAKSATGQRVQGAVGGAINGVFGALFGDDPTPTLTTLLGLFEQLTPVFISLLKVGKAVVGGIFEALLPMLQPLLTAFGNLGQNQEMLHLFERFGQLLGFVGGLVTWFVALVVLGVPTVFGGITELFVQLISWFQSIGSWFSNIGEWLSKGLADGITNGAHWVWESITNLGHNAVEWLKDKLKLHSPSRVMMEIGGFMGEGLAIGLDESQQQVSDSMGGMFHPTRSISDFSSPGASGAGSGHGAPSVSITFNIPETSSSAQEIADAARPMVETAFAELLERMAISAGVG